ncbi:PRC-barrel domain protein [Breoghania corrubedonensis]|uniref:PRC-barrel domain protein n=1 Tax=Breoghania corrubedonensis TaxID=665038 RepID=A0A2T5VGS0_9HYPH|nr:PRC-barrel domain-containing protein [Breoghania corrubedonensis]PTW62940.1 PRC-barrel domain protein [Breoghania corrubedonensis]
MIRTLLTTTALTAMLTAGAFAAEPAKTTNDAAGATSYSADTTKTGAADTMSGERYVRAAKGQLLASEVMGETVYNSAGENAESIGDVNDVVMSPEGDAEAIVIGVGGFLGVGEKEVAVNFDRVSWAERDGDRYLTIDATKDDLESAPAFDRSVFEPSQEDMKTSMSDDTATADGSSVAGDMAANDKTMNSQTMDSDTTSAAGSVAASDDAMKSAENGDMAGTSVDPSVLSADEMIGTAVYGANDSDLGEVNDVIVSPDGKLVGYVIDVGGFLGLGEKPVALDASKLNVTKNANGEMQIHTTLTQDELKSYPTYSEEAYKANPDAVLVR